MRFESFENRTLSSITEALSVIFEFVLPSSVVTANSDDLPIADDLRDEVDFIELKELERAAREDEYVHLVDHIICMSPLDECAEAQLLQFQRFIRPGGTFWSLSNREGVIRLVRYMTAPRSDETEPVKLGTSWRSQPARDAVVLAERFKKFAGISRVARIDTLSELNIPVFSISRPLSKVPVTVHSGKGTSLDESRASGLFEAIEIKCSELTPSRYKASIDELEQKRYPYLGPEALAADRDLTSFSWRIAYDYETNKPALVPDASLTMLDRNGPFTPDTNGLASGATFHEALFHALLEVIERHNLSLALVKRAGRSIDLNSVDDEFVLQTGRELKSQHLDLEVKDISDATGIPTYYSILRNPLEDDSHLVAGGLGSHLDGVIALRRSITEALQARAVAIAGAREDLTDTAREVDANFQRSRKVFSFWYEPTLEKAPSPVAIKTRPFVTAIDDVLRLARKTDIHLGRLYYYAYSSPKGVWVVRAILENAESFGLLRTRIGKQVRELLTEAGVL